MFIKLYLYGVIFFSFLSVYAQQATPESVENQPVPGEQLESTKKTISKKEDSIQIKQKYLDKIDREWLDWLSNNRLHDTITGSDVDLNFNSFEYAELPTDTLKLRLAHLDSKSPFNIAYTPGLESVIKSYLKNRSALIEKMITLSDLYFPMFEEQLDKYNMPLEIKYLAVVESALRPAAKSRVGATGLWQFMYSTGKMYDLKISSYVDERSDPLKSTNAACQYLSKLYSMFGDWDLALAAYNSGPGNVSKAIRRSGGYKNYWNIRPFLPRETAGYLPSFLATMYYFEYAKEHGFSKKPPKYFHIETDTIKVKSMIGFDHVSQVLNIPIEDVKLLNPSYKIDIIPHIKGRDHYLRLPVKLIGDFIDKESEIYQVATTSFNNREKPLPQYYEMNSRIRYTVKSGDYLGKIANKFGVRVSEIKRWNALKTDNLKIGQRLTIYPKKI